MHRPPLGQHFLRDSHVVQAIIHAADLSPRDAVLEIGPGKGALTQPLAVSVQQVVAVELDRNLAARLQTQFSSLSHCRIIHSDFLKLDLDRLFPMAHGIKILGNLPYAITSPIFEKILPWPRWETAVFLVQREVGERMRSRPGSRTFGILSLAVQLFAAVEKVALVKPGAFSPPPRVHSMVVRLCRKKSALLPESEIPVFFDLVHAAFAHRRKTLTNSLAHYLPAPKEKVEQWLVRQHHDGTQRAETLGLEDYVQLAPAWSIFRREINLT